MKTLVVAAAIAGVMAASGVSQAGQMVSPMIFGSGEQVGAECAVLNGGTAAIPVTIKIIDDFGSTVSTSNCGLVTPGDFCSHFSPIDNAEAHACIVTSVASVQNLRGSLLVSKQIIDDFGLRQLQLI